MNYLRTGVIVLGSLVMTTSLHAAEGGSSHFLPGVAGDPGIALPPAPGFQVANIVWSQSGSTDFALLEGRLNVGLDVTTVLNLTSLT